MDKDAEQIIGTLPELDRDVYTFMQEKYDELERAGEKYDVAANDTYVENQAAEKFNISDEEAGTIFARTESQIRRMKQEKASR
ncbi:hypothetical protein SAMN05518683_110143 [Salibacterium halotolerans]|uniref:Uncharacterized protein n=2 Tax=Salibacterium halotolerans TaxID=1884432 RepID=A0A1I5TFW5_9BACI|nr:hypothetical protein SAMN05518683_110143 [Salibacterium halotolerans]